MANELSEWKGKRLHFVGIGGAGMSGLARIALSHSIAVSGSDAKDSTVLSALGALGAEVHAKHLAQQVDGADFVIYSTAINQNNV
jgi:UDP-N-acetylmuramate--alanine ligase